MSSGVAQRGDRQAHVAAAPRECDLRTCSEAGVKPSHCGLPAALRREGEAADRHEPGARRAVGRIGDRRRRERAPFARDGLEAAGPGGPEACRAPGFAHAAEGGERRAVAVGLLEAEPRLAGAARGDDSRDRVDAGGRRPSPLRAPRRPPARARRTAASSRAASSSRAAESSHWRSPGRVRVKDMRGRAGGTAALRFRCARGRSRSRRCAPSRSGRTAARAPRTPRSSRRVPVSSTTSERFATSTTRPPKISHSWSTSVRCGPSTASLNSASSRASVSSGSRSRIFSTLTSLCSCFVTWSIGCTAPSSVSVMREIVSSSVGPTASVSMLNARRANRPATRVRTPGLFSTRIERMCLRPVLQVAGRLELVEADQLLGPWLTHALSPPCPARPGRRGSSGTRSPRR